MKAEIVIKSNLFPSYPNEEDDINPGRFGKKLAEFIKMLLEDSDIKATDLYPTDACYELRIVQSDFGIYITVGNIDGEENIFLIYIESKISLFKRLFKKISTENMIRHIYSIIIKEIKNNKNIELVENNIIQ